MLRALLLTLLLCAAVSWGQEAASTVTVAQIDAAVASVTTTAAEDDPLRIALLKLYAQTRAALQARDQFNDHVEAYTLARAGAVREAAAIEVGLSERQRAPDQPTAALATITLAELEQHMQVSKVELEALKRAQADIQGTVDNMPKRAAEIRGRLTELGGVIPDMQSRLTLLPKTVQAGGETEANVWLIQAQLGSAQAEKAALDQELLSQPVRLQLLTAQQDRANQDINELERQLQAMERRAGSLREGEATKAHAGAEKALAGAQGKHQLVQQLADENAALSASFIERGRAIEVTRMRELTVGDQAERLASSLKSIERKLNLLGMSTSVGQVLQEQQAQLPNARQSDKEMTAVGEEVRDSSLRQIELEDDRRQLLDARRYVDERLAGLDEKSAQPIREDLLDLARQRRDFVMQALDLENLYAASLGNLQFNQHRYAMVVKQYRLFIQERLLWIPSRDPFSLFRTSGVSTQIDEVFSSELWAPNIKKLPAQLLKEPLTALAIGLVLVLLYRSRRIGERLVASGRDVGYVRTDKYSNTVLALALSLLLSIRWPLLMYAISKLFSTPAVDSDLAIALHAALSVGAVYFWGMEFLRIILLPKGLVAAHFRWPAKRTAFIYKHVVLLEQAFLPALILGFFFQSLYPRDVGGPLAALAVILLLLSLANFFRYLPQFMPGKMSLLLTEHASTERSVLSRLVRLLLVWVPVGAIIAVLFGYIYTAAVFSLLLAKTLGVCALVFLLSELALRWLQLARRRMIAKAREEATAAVREDGQSYPEEEVLENDPELLNDEGTKLINLLTLFGLLVGLLGIWSAVFPALGILDSVQLWHQTGIVDGQVAQVPVTLADIVGALLIAVLGWVALQRIPGLLEILLRQNMGVHPASAYAATRVFQYAGTGALVAAVLSSLGGSWSQIQWAVAALSLGIGFGLQEIVANFISGLIILFEQPIRVGDTVTVGNVSGRVTKIRIRATTIRDFDRRELLVPNKEFITQQLLNWTLSDQVTRSTIEVGVAYGTDLDHAMAVVREAALQQPLILNDPEPIVTFEQFGDNSLLIKVRFFMDQLDQRLGTTSDLMVDINRRLNEQGIVVAFPQRDVHLDSSRPLEIRVVPPTESRRADPADEQ